MTEEQHHAYEWALNQQYQSVSARHARTLAFWIKDLLHELFELGAELESAKESHSRFKESLNEALNSGDGAYRP